jgi:hypothetical protein
VHIDVVLIMLISIMYLFCRLADGPIHYGVHGKKEKGDVSESNLSAVLAKFEELGLTPICIQLDPRMFGHPQSRQRHRPCCVFLLPWHCML